MNCFLACSDSGMLTFVLYVCRVLSVSRVIVCLKNIKV